MSEISLALFSRGSQQRRKADFTSVRADKTLSLPRAPAIALPHFTNLPPVYFFLIVI